MLRLRARESFLEGKIWCQEISESIFPTKFFSRARNRKAGLVSYIPQLLTRTARHIYPVLKIMHVPHVRILIIKSHI